jgi:hypothetical protein
MGGGVETEGGSRELVVGLGRRSREQWGGVAVGGTPEQGAQATWAAQAERAAQAALPGRRKWHCRCGAGGTARPALGRAGQDAQALRVQVV